MKYLLLITLFFFQSSHILWAQAQPNFYTPDSRTRKVELREKRREIEYQRQLRQQELDNQRLEIEVRQREFENQRRRFGAIRESQPALQQYEVPNTSFVFSGGNLEKLDKGGTVSLKELIVATLAQADALAKLLIEKGLITEAEFMQKLSKERPVYQK